MNSSRFTCKFLCCRVKTRIQRADTRLDISGIRTLIDELQSLPCDQQSLVQELEVLLEKKYLFVLFLKGGFFVGQSNAA